MRTFGLIGKTLTHSFSKAYFTQKFENELIADAEYHLFPLESIGLINSLISNYPDLRGLNVTIPYKADVIPFITKIDKVAQEAGAVNCIKIQHSESSIITIGYNTDVYGFSLSLEPLLKPWHTSALVLGSGGAAKAVQLVLNTKGIKSQIVSRHRSSTSIEYSEITPNTLAHNLLIINTTPLGMYPLIDDFPPIPYEFLGEKHLLYDLIYNPTETIFLAKGKIQGATIKNGLEMLQLQAEKSWEIWNNDHIKP